MPRPRLCLLLIAAFLAVQASSVENAPPNIVLIFLDDAGYGDFSAFNSKLAYQTPNIDQLAAEGSRFQNFYVPQAVCSASRAALLTGSYPGRTGVFAAHAPKERGLDPHFPVLSELLKPLGYASGIVGKWHLGDQPDTRPHARGFDFSSGLMYSNDMWKHHPGNPDFWGKFPLQYWRNGEIVDEEIDENDQKRLTQRYTEEAVSFIRDQAGKPFFLYLAHSMPHVPLYCSDAFAGRSGAGLYGDVIMELDWSVGQINTAVKDAGIEAQTIVIFTSDNGPWLVYGDHAGQTPFREGKRTSFEGGTRAPCIIKFPGRIEAGSVSEKAFCSIDVVPTLLNLAHAPHLPASMDGKDQWDLIANQPAATNPQPYYAFTTDDRLEAILSSDGRWKLHLEHPYHTVVAPGENGKPGKGRNHTQALALYDLERDPRETMNLLDAHPNLAAELGAFAQQHLAKFPALSQPAVSTP